MLTFTIGTFFEQATAALTRGELQPIEHGKDYCPDVKITNQLYGESKSIGKSARAIIYANRAERQHRWCIKNGYRLNYYFWRHNVYASRIRGKKRLLDALAENCKEVLVVPEVDLTEFIKVSPWIINNRNPLNYQEGWRVNYAQLKALCLPKKPKIITVGKRQMRVTVYEHI